jgi:hypothetical protein
MDPGENGAGACAAELTSTRLESFGMERLSPPHAALGNWQSRFITPSRQKALARYCGNEPAISAQETYNSQVSRNQEGKGLQFLAH